MRYVLSDEEKEFVAEALRQAVIFMQESPNEETPIRKVREALRVITSALAIDENETSQRQ